MATANRSLPAGVRPHTAAVVRHHEDATNPDKPLFLLVPGGMIAVMALLTMIVFGVAAAETKEAADFTKYVRLIVLLIPVYFVGMLVFCYGYELYDWPRAIRRTLWWGLLGLAAVFVIAAIIFALRKADDADFDIKGGDGKGTLSKLKNAVFSDASGDVVSEFAEPMGEKLISLNLSGAGAADTYAATTASADLGTCLKCGLSLPLLSNGFCPSCSATRMRGGPPQIGV